MKKLPLSRIIAILMVIAFIVMVGWSFYNLYTRWHKYCNTGWVLGLRIIQLSAGMVSGIIISVIASLQRRRFLAGVSGFAPLRTFSYCLFLAVVVTTIVTHYHPLGPHTFSLRSIFFSIFVLLLCPWALLVVTCSGKLSPKFSKIWRKIDLLVANIVITLLLLECALTLFVKFSRSPFFWDQNSLKSTIESYRAKPGSVYFNTNINSLGYHDQEFFRAGDKDFVVGLLGDSFAFGVVPYDYNFVTIAERMLQKNLVDRFTRVAIHNHGIPCIGMPEYAHLLQAEVLKFNPAVVVLCVFVGNDIGGIKKIKRKYYTLEQWWLGRLSQRMLIYYREQKKTGGNVAKIGKPSPDIPPFIHDINKERPTFSLEQYLNIEADRMEICNTVNPVIAKRYLDFFELMVWFQRVLGNKLVLVLIPDEFQVNDQIYRQALQKKPAFLTCYDREAPQKKIGDFCNKQGIKMLNLLSALRQANKEIRVYHLRDSHLNARGNKVVGEEIGKFLLRHYFPKLATKKN